MSKLQYIIDAVEDAINERELLLLRLREQNANSVYEPNPTYNHRLEEISQLRGIIYDAIREASDD